MDIPANELWLYQDAEAYEAVAAGLKEAAEGKITKMNLSDL